MNPAAGVGQPDMKKLLIVSPTPTHPQNAGSRARVFALARALQATGHDVHFFFVRRERGDEAAMQRWWGNRYHAADYTEPPQRWAKPSMLGRVAARLAPAWRYNLPLDAWFDERVLPPLAALQAAERFDAVLVEYVFMSRALEAFPDPVLRLIDTHDAFADRFRTFLDSGREPDWFSTSRDEEARGLRRAHAVLAIQDGERQVFEQASGVPTVTVGHLVDERCLYSEAAASADGARLLFVGSGNPVNVASVQHFIAKVLPRIRDRQPTARVVLAGRICQAVRPGPGLELMGELDDLAAAYRSATLVVAPMQFGTGLNIKVIEALGHGMPLVATPNAVKGIDTSARSFVVAEGDAAFADAVCTLALDAPELARLSANALRHAAVWNAQQLAALQQVFVGQAVNA